MMADGGLELAGAGRSRGGQDQFLSDRQDRRVGQPAAIRLPDQPGGRWRAVEAGRNRGQVVPVADAVGRGRKRRRHVAGPGIAIAPHSPADGQRRRPLAVDERRRRRLEGRPIGNREIGPGGGKAAGRRRQRRRRDGRLVFDSKFRGGRSGCRPGLGDPACRRGGLHGRDRHRLAGQALPGRRSLGDRAGRGARGRRLAALAPGPIRQDQPRGGGERRAGRDHAEADDQTHTAGQAFHMDPPGGRRSGGRHTGNRAAKQACHLFRPQAGRVSRGSAAGFARPARSPK
jgi:hypothetical protein